MCIMLPLKFALHKSCLNGSEPCWRWALNSLSRAGKRKLIDRTNNLIVPGNIKINEKTKETLWRLLMCLKNKWNWATATWCTEQLRNNSCRPAFQGRLPTTVCVRVCVHTQMCVHVCRHLSVCVYVCACVWWIAFGDAWKNITRIQAMWVTKHY